MISEQDKKERYRKFFNDAMDKFNISSPADLKTDEQKKKFFNYLDANWKEESNEDLKIHGEIVNEANAFLKARATAIWEGKDSFEFNGKTYPLILTKEEKMKDLT